MATAKNKPAKGKKGLRGRMPTKRSINLVLVDENKISIPKAILGIILIVALAAVFGKFLVYDRIMAVSRAEAKVVKLRDTLDDLTALKDSFGDVETTYAHYTIEGMTEAELSLVDRLQVLDLMAGVLPDPDDADDDEVVVRSWSVSENVLTVEVRGESLETLNALARSLEQSPIVDSCTITTANKESNKRTDEAVLARMIVYLQKPAEEVSAP